jgi:hypothetical protein
MILVLSTDMYEQGTDPVVEWLVRSGCSFLRLSMRDLALGRADLVLDIVRGSVILNGIDLCSAVNVIWYRRLEERPVLESREDRFRRMVGMDADLKAEAMDVIEYLFYALRDKQWLPDYRAVRLNKLVTLNKAARHGIRVPDTKILTRRFRLREYHQQIGSGVITKPVHRNVVYREADHAYVAFTHRMQCEDIEYMPDSFFASLYQEFIEAEFEVRVFYLDGRFEALALLPDERNGRSVDVKRDRMAGKVKHERFLLTEQESSRLCRFLQDIGLNICTLDLLWKEGGITLLDVNPLGQYLFESQVGNTYLEKQIADWLINTDKGIKKNRYAYT